MMSRLYNQLFSTDFLATDLKLCIAIRDELKMCSCYFEEKWGRIGEEGNRGTSPARGHHQLEDSYSSMNPAHLEKITRQKRFILPVLKRWPPERLIKDKMNKYIIMIN